MSREGQGNRRRFLGLAAAGCVLGSPLGRIARAAVPDAHRLSFYNLHTEESLSTVFWQDGGPLPAALAEIDWHLRDFRTGEVHAIDLDLLDLLCRLCGRMGHDGPIHVISGYRSAKTNAMLAAHSGGVAKNSYHLYGKAIDIRLPGRPLREVRQAALDLARGGVGFYPSSDFVHVDTGPVRRW
ncbi:MAG TPA: YcbK family protein [Geminicoccaceae bacterium]|nr:YcbK family protein [Geminicoccaceae bacterium]